MSEIIEQSLAVTKEDVLRLTITAANERSSRL